MLYNIFFWTLPITLLKKMMKVPILPILPILSIELIKNPLPKNAQNCIFSSTFARSKRRKTNIIYGRNLYRHNLVKSSFILSMINDYILNRKTYANYISKMSRVLQIDFTLDPFSCKKQCRFANCRCAASHVGHNSSAHVARSGSSRT